MNSFLIDVIFTYLMFRFFIRKKRVKIEEPRIQALENQLLQLSQEIEILKMELWVRR